MATCRSLLFVFLVACAGAPAAVRGAAEPLVRGRHTIPLTTVTFSGHRYVADVDLGLAKPVPLMIHGNAGVFLTLTHEAAEKLTGGPVKKVEDYGYSGKGRGLITVAAMRVGDSTFADLRDIPVFDYSDSAGAPVQGMLGVRFLLANDAAVDFSRDVLVLGVTRAGNPNKALLLNGYRVTPLRMNGRDRPTIDVWFACLNSALPITPSTVAEALTLHHPFFAGRIPMTRAPSPDRSPRGTTPEVFLADSVRFRVEGVSFVCPASFGDIAEYGAVRETDLESAGYLGFDWMKEHAAVIDYANRNLYFKP